MDFAQMGCRAAILAQVSEAPTDREVCGLVVATPTGTVVQQSGNRCDRPGAFELDPAAVLAAGQRGRIVAIYHSHLDGSVDFSPRDAAGARWWRTVRQIVIGVRDGRPVGWAQYGWAGRRWVLQSASGHAIRAS